MSAEKTETPESPAESEAQPGWRVPWRALALGAVFLIAFTYISVTAANRIDTVIPSTQICSLSILFSLLLVLVLNPLLRLLRCSVLSRREIILVFIMATVPAGLPVYGYVGNIIGLVATLNSPHWNTPQRQWDERASPYLDPGLFLGAPLFQARDVRDWKGFNARLLAAGKADTPGPARRLWQLLPGDARDQVALAAAGETYTEKQKEKALKVWRERRKAQGGNAKLSGWETELAVQELEAANRYCIVRGIKQAMERADLYRPEDFQNVALPPEAQKLLQLRDQTLGQEDVKRLNRFLLEAAFPQDILPSKFIPDQAVIRDYIRGQEARNKQPFPVFVKNPRESWGAFATRLSHWRQAPFFGDIAWSRWAGPLLYWAFIAALFLVLFYSLNELVFKQWYRNEQLSFPIAQLGEAVLETDEEGSLIPPVFRNPLFALGFAIAFCVLLYNVTARAQWLGGMRPIDLRGVMDRYLAYTALHGMIPFRLEIYFSAIGLAFLLPTEVSFSIWFFYLLSKLQVLMAVQLGYGVDGWSFQHDWFQTSSFLSAQGGGALHVFGLVYLYRVRRQIFACFIRWARPQAKGAEEVQEYTVPSLLFFLSSLGVFALMWYWGISLGMSILTYLGLLLLTIGIARLVSECGLLTLHVCCGPFHLMKMFGFLRFPFLFATKGLAMVMMLLQGFFLETKTFIVPTMLNAKFLAVRGKISQRSFVITMLVGVVLAIALSMTFSTILVNDLGIYAMRRWLFRSFPLISLDNITSMMNNPEGMSSLDSTTVGWYGFGALLCGALMYGRTFLFWLPHPIGLVLFADKLLQFYWFNFFIAWACKKAAIKYCDTEKYKVIRGFFIGLIVGAVAAIGVATLIGIFYDPNVHTSLNPQGR